MLVLLQLFQFQNNEVQQMRIQSTIPIILLACTHTNINQTKSERWKSYVTSMTKTKQTLQEFQVGFQDCIRTITLARLGVNLSPSLRYFISSLSGNQEKDF